MNQLLTAFNSGEVTPLLAGRVDLPNMARACRIMRGFLPGITGGAFRRPPLVNVSAAGATGSRLIPFQVSTDASYVLEVVEDGLYVWDATTGNIVTLIPLVLPLVPWPLASLDRIGYVQSNDVMWFVHPETNVYELQRTPAGWTLTEMPWKYPPLRDENLTAITIRASALSGAITLTASAALFDPQMVGSYFEISHFRSTVSSELVVPIIPAAAALLSFSVIPTAGQSFTINGTTYFFATAPTGPNQVLIGTLVQSRDNAIAAINAAAGGAGFGIGTRPNPDVTAESGGDSTTSVAATGTLTTDGTNAFTSGTNSEFTIGSVTYRAESGTMGVSGSTYDFRKGATDQDTLANLVKAINLTGVGNNATGDYTASLVAANPLASAALQTAAIGLTAKAAGAGGNSVVTTTAHTGGHQSFGAATLTGGNAAPTYKLKAVARTLGDPGNAITVDSDLTAPDAWNTPTLTGGAYYGTALAPATSPEITVKGAWDFTSYGRWTGNVYVERKNAAGTWDILRQVTGRLDTNRTFSGIEDPAAVLRIRVENMAGLPASGVDQPRFVLEAVQSITHGLVRITGFTSSTVVNGTTVTDIFSTDATPNWREGAHSSFRGFPAAVAMHEQRLIFAGNTSEPQKLWASASGDFRNFEETGFDDGSWQYGLATAEGNAIRWIASQSVLVVGTAGDEWILDGGDTGITPTNVTAKRQSAWGSDPVQALIVGSIIIFIQRGGLILREYVFDYQNVGYVAPDLTQLVEHLTRDGLRMVAQQRAPWSILWAVTWGGDLLACTYSRENEVIAWVPIPIDGDVESVAVVYGQRGAADEVWISVLRATGRRLERFDPRHWIRLHAGDFCYHMDSAATGGTAGVLSNLVWLNGETVKVVADGIEQPDQVVTANAITVAGAASITVGRAQPESVLQPAIFDIPTRQGTSQGSKFLTVEFSPRFYMTRGAGYARAPGKEVWSISFRDSLNPEETAPPPFSGDKPLSVPGNFDDSADTTIYAQGIHACNVLAMVLKTNVSGT
jgi:hypothetical protein